MIVTCQECSTSFQLDESRIPASGARVRCSRCKHAFFLPRPSTSPDDAIQSVVEEAIASESFSAPHPTQDLAAPAPPSPRAHAPMPAEPDEEDWQFSQDIPAADEDARVPAAPAASAPAPRPDSFDLTGDFGRGLDPGSSGTSRSEKSAAPRAQPTKSRPAPASIEADARANAKADPAPTSPPPPARDESSFGTVDDFSALIEDEDGPDAIDLDTSRAPRAKANAAGRKTPGATGATAKGSEELGDPESWDLLGEERARPSVPAPTPVPRSMPRATRPPAAVQPAAAPLDLFADTPLPLTREERATPARWQAPVALVGRLAGWVVTLVCVAWVASGLVRTEWSRFSERPAPVSLGPIVAETTRVGWAETSRAGLVLVVEGFARNTAGSAAPAPFELVLLDAKGARLEHAAHAVGLPIPDATLREAPLETLAAARDAARRDWAARPLAPGEVRAFTIVSLQGEIPEHARRWLLESGTGPRP